VCKIITFALMRKAVIAFLYPSHYPVSGGSSMHGYFLARELSALGYRLISFPRTPDGFSKCLPYRPWFVLWAILTSDLVYLRISPEGKSTRLLKWLKLLRKPHVVELNGPSDELRVTKGYTLEQIEQMDRELATSLTAARAVITVSEVMQRWCKQYLQLEHVYVIENGGEQYDARSLRPDASLMQQLDDFSNGGSQLILWSGNAYPWQGVDEICKLIETASPDMRFVLVSDSVSAFEEVATRNNVLLLPTQSQENMRYLITQAHAGLALYGDFSWFRLGEMYNSSLKLYEYLANGLWVVTNYPLFGSAQLYVGKEASDMIAWLNGKKEEFVSPGQPYRSWRQVALETAAILEK